MSIVVRFYSRPCVQAAQAPPAHDRRPARRRERAANDAPGFHRTLPAGILKPPAPPSERATLKP